MQTNEQVTFVGSDGVARAFLAKPKDDLRKDTRMMEAAGVLNRVFREDPRARRRGLCIRRFAVLALTEDCGLVEWVPHTLGLRHAVQDTYAARGLFDRERTNQRIKAMYDAATQVPRVAVGEGGDPRAVGCWGNGMLGLVCECTRETHTHTPAPSPPIAPQSRKKAPLLDSVLAMFPPCLHRWLLAKFPEPSAWLGARLGFSRSAAVWSMVGHLVGLGDRHGENILLDRSTGDVVHVDFSCLFDRGLTLEKPELVPFRWGCAGCM